MYKLTLPLPPSVNHYWIRKSNGGVALSERGRTFKHEVAIVCRENDVTPLQGHITLHIDIYRDNMRSDLDNFFKGLLDALQGYAYYNDNQIVAILAYRHDDTKNARCVVTVKAQAE